MSLPLSLPDSVPVRRIVSCRVGGGRWASWAEEEPTKLYVGRSREEATGACYLAIAGANPVTLGQQHPAADQRPQEGGGPCPN